MKLRCFAVFLLITSIWVPLVYLYVNKGTEVDVYVNKGHPFC